MSGISEVDASSSVNNGASSVGTDGYDSVSDSNDILQPIRGTDRGGGSDDGKFYQPLVPFHEAIKEGAREVGASETDLAVLLFAVMMDQEVDPKNGQKTDTHKTGESETIGGPNLNRAWLKNWIGLTDSQIDDIKKEDLVEQTRILATLVIPVFQKASPEQVQKMGEETRGGESYAAGDEEDFAATLKAAAIRKGEEGFTSGVRHASDKFGPA